MVYAKVASFAAKSIDSLEEAALKKLVTRDDNITASREDFCFLVSKWFLISERPPWLIKIID